MNIITLDELLNRYEENIDMLYGADNDEIFNRRYILENHIGMHC